MKKLTLAVVMAVFAVSAFSQTDPFLPPNPISMGMGSAFTANAEGYNAFFYNPAGFARKSELTVLSINAYGTMDKVIYDMMAAAINGENPLAAVAPKDTESKDLYSDLAALGISSTTIDTLSAAANDIGAFLSDAYSVDTAATETAIESVLNSEEYSSYLSGIDISGMTEEELQTAMISVAIEIATNDPDLVAQLTADIVAAVDTAVPGANDTLAANATAATTDVATSVAAINSALADLFPSGNANAGIFFGVGYVGKGLGLGLFGDVNAKIYTPSGGSILQSKGRVMTTLTLAGGFAFNIWDGFSVGVGIRPTLIGYAPVDPAAVFSSLISDPNSMSDMTTMAGTLFANGIYKGFRVGLDAGALLDLGDFTIGLAVKDIIPWPASFKQYTGTNALSDFLSDLSNFQGMATQTELYAVPALKVNIGVQWHPKLGVISDIIDPRIGLDIFDVFGFARTAEERQAALLEDWNVLDLLNIGAQIKLFKFISLSAGYNQGMLAAGLGLDLFLVEINAAVGGRYNFENGNVPASITDFSEVAFSVEVALLRL